MSEGRRILRAPWRERRWPRSSKKPTPPMRSSRMCSGIIGSPRDRSRWAACGVRDRKLTVLKGDFMFRQSDIYGDLKSESPKPKQIDYAEAAKPFYSTSTKEGLEAATKDMNTHGLRDAMKIVQREYELSDDETAK